MNKVSIDISSNASGRTQAHPRRPQQTRTEKRLDKLNERIGRLKEKSKGTGVVQKTYV
ncbi:MAG: hypothetical protein Q7V32_17505 [Methylicorpusculum sp.]|nr:hypothetical protein [Methylicorpusculum sp.]